MINRIRDNKIQAFISTQIVGEFYTVLTKPSAGLKAPLRPKDAAEEVESLMNSNLFTLLSITDKIILKAIKIASNNNTSGVKFWDMVIVATMLEKNGIEILYIDNDKDSKGMSDLIKIETL